MAKLDNKVLFMTTSPRTAEKMIPEIRLLNEHFHGQKWNQATQKAFMDVLKDEDFFIGSAANDPAFSARDRINRAPKSLGFIVLEPTIRLTDAGQALISSEYTEDVFLRQLLKFQLPSPFHRDPTGQHFMVKPYLEIFRLIRYFGTLHFEELQFFGLQLTRYDKFDEIVHEIESYRLEKSKAVGKIRAFQKTYFENVLRNIYAIDIKSGHIKTRESHDASIKKFLDTKRNNMRDYTDACIRYLRATGLINISYIGRSLSIIPERIVEVDFFLENTNRDPIYIDDTKNYLTYLGDPTLPSLMQIDRAIVKQHKEEIIANSIINLKNHSQYADIDNMFAQIVGNKNLYNAPLMLEWNTWRAMTMLDGGDIKANLKFDDFGQPMSTAMGNIADIVCDYGDFYVIVEVTMATGQRQYETESEPVSRHLAKIKRSTGKPAFCLFLAPKINEACVAHFYALHRMNIAYYGGTSEIMPLPLSVFRKMVEDSCRVGYTPNPGHVRAFFEWAKQCAISSANEREWFDKIQDKAMNWLFV